MWIFLFMELLHKKAVLFFPVEGWSKKIPTLIQTKKVVLFRIKEATGGGAGIFF
jgi:hypothetical protein